MRSREFPSPLRHFFAQLDDLRSEESLDMARVGRLVVDLASDVDYLGPFIKEMPAGSTGGTWLVRPERGPRLVLFHRPDGVMSRTHSHGCWVAIAPVRGVESHQRWEASCQADGTAQMRMTDERALHPRDVVTLTPPGDIHSHGHVTGTGPSPYSLILLADDMLAFERKEFDPARGRWRKLEPGDPGHANR